jgi:RNA-binding protein
MPIYVLDSSQRSALRSAAHPLKPVVLLGAQGLTEAVLAEIDRNLSAHGLIKVKVPGDDRSQREELLLQICDVLGAAPVHHLGKTFVLFRPTADDPDGAALIASGKRAAPTVSVKPREETFIPKKLAAAGKSAKDARNRERGHQRKRAESRGTARERYLGSDDRRTAASARDGEVRRPGTRDGEQRRPRHTETVSRPSIRPERPRRRESGEGGAAGYERFGVRRPRAADSSDQARRTTRFEGGDRPARTGRKDKPRASGKQPGSSAAAARPGGNRPPRKPRH